MFQHQDKYSNGFTLVEALVALAILTVGLIPIFNTASSAVRMAGSTRNSLIAAHLAQEGAEVARAMRDNNWFLGVAFTQGFEACSGGCRVQWDSDFHNEPPNPAGQNSPPLKWDSVSGLYSYDAGIDTPFYRTVSVERKPSEMKVVSEVTWNERGADKTFSLEYHLFNWLQ